MVFHIYFSKIKFYLYYFLNLPKLIEINSPGAEARITYVYSADGVKQRVIREWNPERAQNPLTGTAAQNIVLADIDPANLTQAYTTDYAGNLIYENNILNYIRPFRRSANTKQGFASALSYRKR